MRTSFQSTSSSSAMIIGRLVLMPWPISGFFAMIVTMPSGAILMKELGSSGGGGAAPGALREDLGHIEVAGDQHAAAGQAADPQEGAPIQDGFHDASLLIVAARTVCAGRGIAAAR